MIKETMAQAKARMAKAAEDLRAELASVRTGRASTALLEHLKVEYYGTPTPLNQVATLGVPEPSMLTVQPWDPSLLAVIDKVIRSSDLGLNPVNDGKILKVPIPPLTEERRKELIKVVRHEAENARIAVRNLRRDANHVLKEALKKKEVSENDERRAQDDVQKLTDRHVAEIDTLLQQKENELMAV